jgi:hypothetical protein
VPAAAVGALMMGPDASAILTGLLIVGRPSGFQFVAVDQRLFPLPLSHDTAETLTASENKATQANAAAVLFINHLAKTSTLGALTALVSTALFQDFAIFLILFHQLELWPHACIKPASD